MIGRLLLFFGVMLVTLLAAEGALSVGGGPSLTTLLHPDGTTAARRPRSASAPTPAPPPGSPAAEAGPRDQLFSVHDDPLVGYVLTPDTGHTILDGTVIADHLGLRARPGGPPPDDALRVVILGDSVAFGLGVNDDETLAARLEARLAELRGEGGRPVVCRTVAIPSWNHRAAAAFLLDHWDELRPELVLFMPIRNDVYDIDSAYATGDRRVAPDPASRDPWLSVSVRWIVSNLIKGLVPDADNAEVAGADAVFSDLCAESRRRHDENAAGIVLLEQRLAARGCRLAIVWNVLGDYTWFLSARLHALAPGLPMLPLLRWTRDEFTLGVDPHPNAVTLDVWARWLAEDLVERGWIPRGAGHALPEARAMYTDLRVQAMPPAEDWPRLAEEAHGRWRARLRPEIDFRTGHGMLQVFGGLNPDFTARSRLLAILRADGPALELELGPLEDRPDLYPLDVQVEADGQALGSVTVTAAGPARARLTLPARADASQPLEVRLSPERWIVRSQPGHHGPGTVLLSSFKPLRLACRPE